MLKGESRTVEEIPLHEFNSFLREFIITIRKKENNEDYEPSTLCAMIANFERFLRKKNNCYRYSIMEDIDFEKVRTALKSKQKDLKTDKGRKPNPSVPLTEVVNLLYDTELSRKSTPDALLNTVWFNKYSPLRAPKL